MNSTLLRIRESSLEGINVSLKISLLTSLQSRLFHPSLGQPKARPKSPCGYARLERPHPSQLQAYLTTAPLCPTLRPLPPASDAGEATGPSVPAFLPHFEKGGMLLAPTTWQSRGQRLSRQVQGRAPNSILHPSAWARADQDASLLPEE